MKLSKKIIISAGILYVLPMLAWSAAPVVDDSENFAMLGEQQRPRTSVGAPKYDEAIIENDSKGDYSIDAIEPFEGPALAKDDLSTSNTSVNSSAHLIQTIQNLQKEVQELRGQLEVQAHDLKLLQQQQVAFYKDLDSRIGASGGSQVFVKPKDGYVLNTSPSKPVKSTVLPVVKNSVTKANPSPIPSTASRGNPADEQISYLAAYELIKNKRFEEAIPAMETFVQKYPKGGYTANAEYWLGELYLVKRDYEKSIYHFETVLQQFPSSSKTAASLLKSGYAYAAKGDQEEAKRRFENVIKNFPGTQTAKLANSKLQHISI